MTGPALRLPLVDVPGRQTEASIVEWYRIDASRRIVGTLAIGASIMLLGSVVSAMGLLISRGNLPHPILAGRHGPVAYAEADPGHSPVLEIATGLVALGCLLGGGVTAIVGLRRALEEESYLALRRDGALFVTGDTERFVAWDDVEDVRWDAPTDALVFVSHEGEAVSLVARFADVGNEELAKRARAVRRRAVHGLLGPAAASTGTRDA